MKRIQNKRPKNQTPPVNSSVKPEFFSKEWLTILDVVSHSFRPHIKRGFINSGHESNTLSQK